MTGESEVDPHDMFPDAGGAPRSRILTRGVEFSPAGMVADMIEKLPLNSRTTTRQRTTSGSEPATAASLPVDTTSGGGGTVGNATASYIYRPYTSQPPPVMTS